MSQENSHEITFGDLIRQVYNWYRYLLSKIVVLLLFAFLGGALGLLYAYLKKPDYTAVTTFVLEDANSSGALGQYAGLASMIGIDLGGGSGNGIFQGDNILELYKSKSMIRQTLLTPHNFDGKVQLLVDRYIAFNHLRDKWAENPSLKNISFKGLDRRNSTRLQDSLLGQIVKEINDKNLTVIKPDKKLSIINVKVKSKDEQFAKAFNDHIVMNVNDFYIKTKTKKSLQNVSVLQHQTDSVRSELNRAIYGVATAIDANPNPNPSRQVLKIPSQRKQIDVQANTAILTELVKNLELSKVSLRKETPLIQVLDEPFLPLQQDKPGKLTSLIVGCLLATFLAAIFLLVKRGMKQILG